MVAVRRLVVASALALSSVARAQGAAQPSQPAPPAQQPPPAAQPPAPPPPSGAPPATAGSQGQSSAAQPGSPGASSQQVVVNPPQQPPPPGPPSSTTVVNPPAPPATVYGAPYAAPAPEVVVEHRERPNPLGTVATDAAYGGVTGLLVGGGIALVNQGDHWGRDLMVGAGIGLIAGAAVGLAHAAYEQREYDRRARRVAAAAAPGAERVATDGLNRTDKDPVRTAPTLDLAFRF